MLLTLGQDKAPALVNTGSCLYRWTGLEGGNATFSAAPAPSPGVQGFAGEGLPWWLPPCWYLEEPPYKTPLSWPDRFLRALTCSQKLNVKLLFSETHWLKQAPSFLQVCALWPGLQPLRSLESRLLNKCSLLGISVWRDIVGDTPQDPYPRCPSLIPMI